MKFETYNLAKHKENKSIFSQGTYSVDDAFHALPLLNNTPKEYFNWGNDNKYPLWLANISQLFPAEAIIKGTIDLICKDLPDVERGIIEDYVIYGNAFISSNGERLQALASRIGVKGGIYIDDVSYFTRTSDMKHIAKYEHLRADTAPYAYGAPYWSAIIKDILVIAKSTNFAYNVFDNELAVSGILTIKHAAGKDEDERNKIKRKVEERFTGSSNVGKYLIGFAEGDDESIVFTPIPTDSNLTRKYDTLADTARENVYAGFRCYPQLFGIKLQDSFINDEDYTLMLNAYKKLVVNPIITKISDFLHVPNPTMQVEEPTTPPAIIPETKPIYSLFNVLRNYFKGSK